MSWIAKGFPASRALGRAGAPFFTIMVAEGVGTQVVAGGVIYLQTGNSDPLLGSLNSAFIGLTTPAGGEFLHAPLEIVVENQRAMMEVGGRITCGR